MYTDHEFDFLEENITCINTVGTVVVQWQAKEKGHARKEISARMKTTRQDTRSRKSARAWKAQEDAKIIDVQYIDGYVEK